MKKNLPAHEKLEGLLARIRRCDVCAHAQPPLPVQPNPIVRANQNARIRIIGQAPGTLAHASSMPFTDPSGVRLRDWLGVDETEFYNEDFFAITPMGFCFPGQDNKGADKPPRKECAPLWQDSLTRALPNIELTLLVGLYAVKEYLGPKAERNLTETVRQWERYGPEIMPLPHPSWRNNGWIKRHEWFSDELLALKRRVRNIISA
ncbi:uracil-DNA glycosylase [Litorimonas taeanensis]|uniref:Uracil-DNA glycosylase n=1 Tax=Litorimonas taeanensis TaxID=568099 RepID=A0A420WK30_9PROT|nr:uracil-DNA glycosylase family protein [Litorimonas taeanensis]RKQ71299.1 uracil-DNA glycosylase [Litorimonas taeanensis]